MCGIYGIVGKKRCKLQLIKGLESLRYRGYDSCGLSIINQGIQTYKSLEGPNALLKSIPTTTDATIGIAHTRWATHGQVNLKNAHPQCYRDKISIVHNGIITNHESLREELSQHGYTFESQTDTECITLLLDYYLSLHSFETAIELMTTRLEGRFAFACITTESPKEVIIYRKDMPLYISKSDRNYAVSSDIYAFNSHDQFAPLPNETVTSLSPEGCSILLEFLPLPELPPQKDKHQLHTLSEIHEQPVVISQIYKQWLKSPFTLQPRHVAILGCGSSYHSGLILQYWLRQKKIACDIYLSSEVKDFGAYHSKDTLVIAISQSGETADTLIALSKFTLAQKIAICNVDHSSLIRNCNFSFLLNAGKEIGVASTKAFSAQVTALFLLSRQFLSLTIPPIKSVVDTMQHHLYLKDHLKLHAKSIAKYKSLLVLGRHTCFPISLEAALKFKELCYIHAEGLAVGELKHGPLAMIDNNVLIIVLMPQACTHTQTAISEIHARNGTTLVIGDQDICDLKIDIPNHPLGILALNACLQLLAVYTAMEKGLNIDQPRNLAKCVTVE
jgi:glucosamine--fructose-6-phosphate aminotransferase (isomerizing)